MTINTRDQLIDALANNSTSIFVDKATVASTAVGQFFGLFTGTGNPGVGSTPGAASVPTSATTGALPFPAQTAPAKTYIAMTSMMQGNSGAGVEIHDRIAHMGGLSGTSTAVQTGLSLVTTNPGADRIGNAGYNDVQWWLEIHSNLGATPVDATVIVTYDDNTTATLPVIALAATPRKGRMYRISSADGRGIKAVNSVKLSATTGTAGNFGITATRQLTTIGTYIANKPEIADWAQLGLPLVPANACLQFIVPCSTTSTGALRGVVKLAHG